MRLIGLTGGIATGKTSVARFISSKYGAPIINVDDVSRSVTAIGSPILAQIVEEFGEECLKEDGSLNRLLLRNRLSTDRSFATKLEGIVIPAISTKVASILKDCDDAGNEIVFIENAVMVEKGTHENYEEILVVTCSEETQLKRLMARDNQTEDQARAIIKIQMPLAEKESFATFIVRNDSGVDELELELDRVWSQIIGGQQ